MKRAIIGVVLFPFLVTASTQMEELALKGSSWAALPNFLIHAHAAVTCFLAKGSVY